MKKTGGSEGSFSSVTGIMEEIGKHFCKPDVVDEGMKQEFVELVMPSAPPLTKLEEDVFESLTPIQWNLVEKGKRIKGAVRSKVHKFLWTEGKHIWSALSCQGDTTAEKMLAEVFEAGTYGLSANHKVKHGNLPRLIRKNVDGSRGLHYTNGVSFPSPMQHRLFQS